MRCNHQDAAVLGITGALLILAMDGSPQARKADDRPKTPAASSSDTPLDPIAPTSFGQCDALENSWERTRREANDAFAACFGGSGGIFHIPSPCGLPGGHATNSRCAPRAERHLNIQCQMEGAVARCRARVAAHLDAQAAFQHRREQEARAAEERRQRLQAEEARLAAAQATTQKQSDAQQYVATRAAQMAEADRRTKEASQRGAEVVQGFVDAANANAAPYQQLQGAIAMLGSALLGDPAERRRQQQQTRELAAEDARLRAEAAAIEAAEARAREEDRLARETAARQEERARVAAINLVDPFGGGEGAAGGRTMSETSRLIDPFAGNEQNRSADGNRTLVDAFQGSGEGPGSAEQLLQQVVDLGSSLLSESGDEMLAKLDHIARTADARALAVSVNSTEGKKYLEAAARARRDSELVVGLKRLVFWEPYLRHGAAATTGSTTEQRAEGRRNLAQQAWSDGAGALLSRLVGSTTSAGLSTLLESTPTAPPWMDDNPFSVVANKANTYSLEERQKAYQLLLRSYLKKGSTWPETQMRQMQTATEQLLQATTQRQ